MCQYSQLLQTHINTLIFFQLLLLGLPNHKTHNPPPKRYSDNNFTKYFHICHHLSCHLILSQCQTLELCYYSLLEYHFLFNISLHSLIAVPILKSQWLNTINVFLLHITVQSEFTGSFLIVTQWSRLLLSVAFLYSTCSSKLAPGG